MAFKSHIVMALPEENLEKDEMGKTKRGKRNKKGCSNGNVRIRMRKWKIHRSVENCKTGELEIV